MNKSRGTCSQFASTVSRLAARFYCSSCLHTFLSPAFSFSMAHTWSKLFTCRARSTSRLRQGLKNNDDGKRTDAIDRKKRNRMKRNQKKNAARLKRAGRGKKGYKRNFWPVHMKFSTEGSVIECKADYRVPFNAAATRATINLEKSSESDRVVFIGNHYPILHGHKISSEPPVYLPSSLRRRGYSRRLFIEMKRNYRHQSSRTILWPTTTAIGQAFSRSSTARPTNRNATIFARRNNVPFLFRVCIAFRGEVAYFPTIVATHGASFNVASQRNVNYVHNISGVAETRRLNCK